MLCASPFGFFFFGLGYCERYSGRPGGFFLIDEGAFRRRMCHWGFCFSPFPSESLFPHKRTYDPATRENLCTLPLGGLRLLARANAAAPLDSFPDRCTAEIEAYTGFSLNIYNLVSP